jgi:hypothetical protein
LKGIAHFLTGVAIATFFPEVVHAASQTLSFGPLLGGFAGLLPDTLDFKFVRYFERLDDEIDPAKLTDPAGHPDPQAMAEAIAAAMNRAYEAGKRVKVHLHTLRLGADLWRQYSVAFDLDRNQVMVRIGPVVTTGQVPYAGSEPSSRALGRAQVTACILHTYDAEMTIDIFSGPSLAFDKAGSLPIPATLGGASRGAAPAQERGGDAIQVTFLPWHRSWTHSAAMILLLGATGWILAPVYGLVMALAALAHVLEDQLGFMGSNLFFPFSRKRIMGLKLIRSGAPVPNFLAVWISLAVIVLNLDRFSGAPSIPVLPYVLAVIAVPCLAFLGLSAWEMLRAPRPPAPVLAAVEAMDEVAEVDI